jgi:hypothetical protein
VKQSLLDRKFVGEGHALTFTADVLDSTVCPQLLVESAVREHGRSLPYSERAINMMEDLNGLKGLFRKGSNKEDGKDGKEQRVSEAREGSSRRKR